MAWPWGHLVSRVGNFRMEQHKGFWNHWILINSPSPGLCHLLAREVRKVNSFNGKEEGGHFCQIGGLCSFDSLCLCFVRLVDRTSIDHG